VSPTRGGLLSTEIAERVALVSAPEKVLQGYLKEESGHLRKSVLRLILFLNGFIDEIIPIPMTPVIGPVPHRLSRLRGNHEYHIPMLATNLLVLCKANHSQLVVLGPVLPSKIQRNFG
jgi:hypothetical protein